MFLSFQWQKDILNFHSLTLNRLLFYNKLFNNSSSNYKINLLFNNSVIIYL